MDDARKDGAEVLDTYLAFHAVKSGAAFRESEHGSCGGGFARSPACKSFLAAIEDEVYRPVEVLVGGVAPGDSLAPAVDGLLACGHRVTVVREAMCFPARKREQRPPPGWAGNAAVASLADLRESSGISRQVTFADMELDEAHERMESLARRVPRFSSLHVLDEAIPWEFFRTRLEAARTRPRDTRPLTGPALMHDALVTWRSILLGAIYERPRNPRVRRMQGRTEPDRNRARGWCPR